MTAAGPGSAELAAEIPLLPQQQRAVPARHKDQWEADDVAPAAPSRTPRRGSDPPAASSSGRRARSPPCG